MHPVHFLFNLKFLFHFEFRLKQHVPHLNDGWRLTGKSCASISSIRILFGCEQFLLDTKQFLHFFLILNLIKIVCIKIVKLLFWLGCCCYFLFFVSLQIENLIFLLVSSSVKLTPSLLSCTKPPPGWEVWDNCWNIKK